MASNRINRINEEIQKELADLLKIVAEVAGFEENENLYANILSKQRHYIKKVCVVGTESCGKTTLVRNLATYFNTTHVEEAGRYICDEAGGIDKLLENAGMANRLADAEEMGFPILDNFPEEHIQ